MLDRRLFRYEPECLRKIVTFTVNICLILQFLTIFCWLSKLVEDSEGNVISGNSDRFCTESKTVTYILSPIDGNMNSNFQFLIFAILFSYN